MYDLTSFIPHRDCKETCYAGKHECAAAGEEEPEPWKCINCLDCDQDFPTTCEAHGDQHVAFKCFFCCNIATFFCGGKTHFCEQCHKNGWNAVPMKVGECRPGCDGRHPDHGSKKIHCLGCVVCRSLGLNLNTKSAQSKERLAFVKVKKGLPHTAEEAAMAAEQIELERLEAERVEAEKRAADLQRLMDLQLSREEAEKLLDAHGGNAESAVRERREVLRKQEEERAAEAARCAAVATLRSMGFRNSIEELHSILISKNQNLQQVVDVLIDMQQQREGKVEQLVALGWSEDSARSALEQNDWNVENAEAQLKEQKHKVLSTYPGSGGFFSHRIAKCLRKQHFKCLESKGKPCACKEVVAPPAAPPHASARPDEGPVVEEFCGAFAMKKCAKARSAPKQLYHSARLNIAPSLCDDASGEQSGIDFVDDEGFIVCVNRRKSYGRAIPLSENEKGRANASDVKSIDSDCKRDASGGCDDDGADSLVQEFSGAFSKARPSARGSGKFERLEKRVAEPDDDDPDPYGMMPSDEAVPSVSSEHE